MNVEKVKALLRRGVITEQEAAVIMADVAGAVASSEEALPPKAKMAVGVRALPIELGPIPEMSQEEIDAVEARAKEISLKHKRDDSKRRKMTEDALELSRKFAAEDSKNDDVFALSKKHK